MALTRREALKAVVFAPAAVAALSESIGAAGGTRLYPTLATPRWWTAQPLIANTWKYGHCVSMGAAPLPDGDTALQDLRNTPGHGVFTRVYFQLASSPLIAPCVLDGTVSAAIHGIEWHRKIDAVLAMQVVVHKADMTVRGVPLPVSRDTLELALGDPARTRAALGWPLTPVSCEAGDVIAINLGLYADNQSRTLAQLVGFNLYGNQSVDISAVNSATPANTWVEFSTVLPLTSLS